MTMLSLDQLAQVLQEEVDQRGGLVMDRSPSWESEHPRFRLQIPHSSDEWIDIEVGYEMFFLLTSSGYSAVDSAREDWEKLQLLSEFVAVAATYLTGDFQLVRRTFGKRFNMLIETPFGRYVLKPT